tara:strand:+ start:5308 stop:5796 length:489 start_codon:yes stop_codon:yes gene_type:complete
MNSIDRLQLEKMIQANDVEDCTSEIREKRHSKKIREDVTTMIDMKKKYERLSKTNPQQFEQMLTSKCSFLFTNYTDIYNRVKKEELKLSTLWELLNVLERIENQELDQHTGAYEVGNLLKKMYIDGALMKSENLDKKSGKKIKKPDNVKKITWQEYKAMQNK